MVRRCPKCGNFAPVCLVYHHGEPYVEYRCGCGWSSLDKEYITNNRTSLYEEVIDRANMTQFKKGLV